jgi:hypothetical protein
LITWISSTRARGDFPGVPTHNMTCTLSTFALSVCVCAGVGAIMLGACCGSRFKIPNWGRCALYPSSRHHCQRRARCQYRTRHRVQCNTSVRIHNSVWGCRRIDVTCTSSTFASSSWCVETMGLFIHPKTRQLHIGLSQRLHPLIRCAYLGWGAIVPFNMHVVHFCIIPAL